MGYDRDDVACSVLVGLRVSQRTCGSSHASFLSYNRVFLSTSSICREKLGVPSVVAAMIGLSILLLLGVLDWDDCLSEKSAWDTLAWFAVHVGLAGQLTNLGIVTWMSNWVAKSLQSLSLSWPASFAVLQVTYFLIHYLFASQTGHVGALFSAFLAMHIAAGVPHILAALVLAYNTNLFGAITHYSSGQAAVYYGGTLLGSSLLSILHMQEVDL